MVPTSHPSGRPLDIQYSRVVADDVAAFDVSDLNADFVVSGSSTTGGNLSTGGDADVAGGDTVVVQNVGAAATIASKTNVINWTTAAADAAALETAVEAVAINFTSALDVGDMLVFQYNTASGEQRIALGRVAAMSGTAANGWDFEDLAIHSGGIADLSAANYAFIA